MVHNQMLLEKVYSKINKIYKVTNKQMIVMAINDTFTKFFNI